MEQSYDREDEVSSDVRFQQFAVSAALTVRELGTRFWEWCGHTSESLAQFLSLRQADELNENWIDVDSSMHMTITETPQQHLYEQMESYGTASDEQSDVGQDENQSQLNEMQIHIDELEEQLRECKRLLAAKNQQQDDDDSDRSSDDDDDDQDHPSADDDDDQRKMAGKEQLEALERDRKEFGRQVQKLLSEKEALEAQLEKERMEKERLMQEQQDKQEEDEEKREDAVNELRSQLIASREESNRLLSLLNSYNGVGLCSKFKTEKEVQELMVSIVPNEYTSAIELLESSYQMDPDTDVRPYDVCLKVFINVFRHTKYRQHRFFQIIRSNSVFKIDLVVAQKVFWGLIQEHFELLGITPIDEVIDGILEASMALEDEADCEGDESSDDEDYDEDFAGKEFGFRMKKNGQFVGIECDALDEILNHSIMREYMLKCAEISFFVLWAKTPPLRLRGWKPRMDLDSVFDRKIHERIWGDDQPDNEIRAVVFPALYRIESNGGNENLVPITKRFVFCSGMAEEE